eukprot:scaffold180_cov311-Pinguiococcus_pyrenoidosus.AAC.58
MHENRPVSARRRRESHDEARRPWVVPRCRCQGAPQGRVVFPLPAALAGSALGASRRWTGLDPPRSEMRQGRGGGWLGRA